MPNEFEYPKWVHKAGEASILCADPEEEAAQLARWNEPAAPPNQLTSAVRHETPAAAPPPAPKAKGGWPKGKPRAPRKTAQATVN